MRQRGAHMNLFERGSIQEEAERGPDVTQEGIGIDDDDALAQL